MNRFVENVECNTDVLIEILLRLPPKSVFKFKCLSKRWNSLIMDTYFVCAYNQRRRKGCSPTALSLSAFIQTTTKSLRRRRNIGLPWEPPHKLLPIKATPNHCGSCFPGELGYFISSCNGLLLCGRHPMTYHVVNPITKHRVSLPWPHKRYLGVSVGLVCEEESVDLVARYKVVRAGIPTVGVVDNTVSIETYSSETGKWIESTLIATSNVSLTPFEPPVVLRGVFHWSASRGSVAIYDPKEPGGENHLQLIELPYVDRLSYSFGRSDEGLLWYGESSPPNLKIWKLPKGQNGYRRSTTISEEEWTLEHMVTSETLWNDYPVVRYKWKKEYAKLPNPSFDEQCVTFVAFITVNPLVVILRQGQSIYLYHMESKLMEPVRYHGSPLLIDYNWHPYFESNFLSSYGSLRNLVT